MELDKIRQDNDFTGINFGFEKEKFYVSYRPSYRKIGNLRQEFELRAKDIFSRNKNLILGLSSGLDSQSVLHSFFSQGMNITCAFLYHPGYNDNEYQNIKILETKYNFKTVVVEIDPMIVKQKVMDLHASLNLPPNQILHQMFLEQLPKDADFLQGVHGPDFLRHNDKWYIFESANSFEISRLRSLLSIDRSGRIIGFERTPEILLSLLNDDIISSFMFAYNYIKDNKLIYENGDAIPNIDYWDLYLKPFFYGKYWKNELEYFPKYQGCENIEYIINGPKNEYEKNMIIIPYKDFIEFLKSNSPTEKIFYQYR